MLAYVPGEQIHSSEKTSILEKVKQHLLSTLLQVKDKILPLFHKFMERHLPDNYASLVAQMVKSPPAMQDTWVGKIHWRRKWQPTPVSLLLKKEMATYSGILAWKFHDAGAWQASVHGVPKSQTGLSDFTSFLWQLWKFSPWSWQEKISLYD